MRPKRKPKNPEYDVDGVGGGKLCRPNGKLQLPIYLAADIQNYFARRAFQKGVLLVDLVNSILQEQIKKS
jgi:hypothetical protein